MTDDADALVRVMSGAWPYEGTARGETLKERVERELGGRRRVRSLGPMCVLSFLFM